LADQTCGGTRPNPPLDHNTLLAEQQHRATNNRSNNKNTRLRVQGNTNTNAAKTSSIFLTNDSKEGRTKNVDFDDVGVDPSQLWNALIHPFLPMRLTGVIWYQGEANGNDPVSYSCRFPAMISDWRKKFNLPFLSFFYVELAGLDNKENFVLLRAAQAAALQLPKVGMATAIDLNDPASPQGAIHPRRKQEVGRRLSLAVRAIQYRERNGLTYLGPKLQSVQFLNGNSYNSDTTLTATIPGCKDETTIIHLGFVPGTDDGLHIQDAPNCQNDKKKNCCVHSSPFRILNSEGNWLSPPTTKPFVIENEGVFIPINTTTRVLGIRYAWEGQPGCILYNGKGGADDHSGIAAAPFEWCAYPSSTKGTWTGQRCQLIPTTTTDYANKLLKSTTTTIY